MRIAAHHIAGTPEHRFASLLHRDPEYAPTCAWPDDCTVQWGHGIIPAVPFFEAFPPGTFIRGEGETIAEAEQKAFAQYQGEFLCRHVWGRRRPRGDTYLNGAGWCRKCGAFRGKMFREVVVLGHHRKPLESMEVMFLEMLDDDDANDRADRKYARALRLRRNLFGAIARSPHPTASEGEG